METKKPGLLHRGRSFYEEHELLVEIVFFLLGFSFDILMTTEVDDLFGIIQQIVYMLIIGSFMYWDFLFNLQKLEVSPRLEKIWKYRQAILHFFMGTLLSVYSIFYFKSASVFSSIIFLILVFGLFIANDFAREKRAQLAVKMGIYTLCLLSFFSMLYPVFLHFIGYVPFFLAVATTCLCVWGIYKLFARKIEDQKLLMQQIVKPSAILLIIFTVCYMMGWIPPVPLSIKHMGIYHALEKKEGEFWLYHERPFWKFWQNGDQHFIARPGDKIVFYVQIFSPAKFSDEVNIRWMYKDPNSGWSPSDKIPMKISGGREEGFRGYTYKQNYQSGDWRVQVETTDGREIGRLYFDVAKSEESGERIFQVEKN